MSPAGIQPVEKTEIRTENKWPEAVSCINKQQVDADAASGSLKGAVGTQWRGVIMRDTFPSSTVP